MYNNSKKETYSLYDCVNGYYLLVNVSQHSLVKYLINKIDGTPWWTRPTRPTSIILEYLDKSINMNGNDTYCSINFAMQDIQALRPYMVLDSNDRIIDIRTWDLENLYVESYRIKRKRYMRPRMKNVLDDIYWDSWAQGSKSWKDQSKKRRQWEK